ncbi:MAG: class I SAM-dependent methyltransferase [Methylovulum sp.]|nr:class I SAM-dependent methyltransferase [Methylovulum sp.]
MLYCLACHGDLTDSPPDLWVCADCGKQYPSINGVDVFILPDALSALPAYLREIDDTKAEFSAISTSLTAAETTGASALATRIARNQSGMSANLTFLEAVYQPIADFVQNHPCDAGGFAANPLKSGYTGDHMLPYFYQDWCGVADYEAVKNLICQTATAHCQDKGNAAVLGAGACGLLYSVANHFQKSYGVDLSLPGLLMAKTLIEGTPLSFQLKEADWQEVTVAPPTSAANDIQFITADVMALPFKSGTLSLVITQYLLDIVSNAELFSQEIYRVLKPSGVWINFSKPFSVQEPAELGRYRLAELPDYFNKLGFVVEDMSCQRFTPFNLATIDAETDNVDDVVHFFTLRKSAALMQIPEPKPISRFFTKNAAVWHEIPRIVEGRGVGFFQKRPLNDQLQGELWWLNVMGKFIAVPAEMALLLESLFALMDGERTLTAVFSIFQDQGVALTEAQFLILIYCLNRQYALIDLHEAVGL